MQEDASIVTAFDCSEDLQQQTFTASQFSSMETLLSVDSLL